MAANQFPIFQKNPSSPCQTIAAADTTTQKTLVTAGLEGALVDNISVTSDDTAAAIVVVTINDGSTDCQIGEVTIPIGAGTDGSTPAVNLLDSASLPFLQKNGGLPLGASAVLKANAKVTLTAGKVLNFVTFGGDY
jgi:hypothetical protein